MQLGSIGLQFTFKNMTQSEYQRQRVGNVKLKHTDALLTNISQPPTRWWSQFLICNSINVLSTRFHVATTRCGAPCRPLAVSLDWYKKRDHISLNALTIETISRSQDPSMTCTNTLNLKNKTCKQR